MAPWFNNKWLSAMWEPGIHCHRLIYMILIICFLTFISCLSFMMEPKAAFIWFLGGHPSRHWPDLDCLASAIRWAHVTSDHTMVCASTLCAAMCREHEQSLPQWCALVAQNVSNKWANSGTTLLGNLLYLYAFWMRIKGGTVQVAAPNHTVFFSCTCGYRWDATCQRWVFYALQ